MALEHRNRRNYGEQDLRPDVGHVEHGERPHSHDGHYYAEEPCCKAAKDNRPDHAADVEVRPSPDGCGAPGAGYL